MQAVALHAATGRADFEIIHEKRKVIQSMDFVLVREDYKLAKPRTTLRKRKTFHRLAIESKL